jgi:O-antigen biosynthesis protein WbqP
MLLDSNKYLLRIGKYLRKFSLDELPNLINILKGEMVFIGPRPALHNQYDLIELRTKYGIDKLKPGITGWAQVNGRDELSLEDKCKFDKEYLEKRSFLFDLKILLLTFSKVILGSNVRH